MKFPSMSLLSQKPNAFFIFSVFQWRMACLKILKFHKWKFLQISWTHRMVKTLAQFLVVTLNLQVLKFFQQIYEKSFLWVCSFFLLYRWLLCFFFQELNSGDQLPFASSQNPVMSLVGNYAIMLILSKQYLAKAKQAHCGWCSHSYDDNSWCMMANDLGFLMQLWWCNECRSHKGN